MKARVHFLNVAEASLAEAEYCVHVAWRLGYITAQQRDELDALIGAVNAPLVGLIRSTRAALSSTVAVVPLAVIAVGYLANAL
jgi:four helix bundle protein